MPSNSDSAPRIDSITPPAAISGGVLELRGSGFSKGDGAASLVRFGDIEGRLVVGAPGRVVVTVPTEAVEGQLTVLAGEDVSAPYSCSIGITLAENLHPVANPAVDAAGNVFTTRSGSRGEKLPVSVFKIDVEGNVKPFISDIVNPTGLLVHPDGTLMVSGRHNGTIYAVSPNGSVEVYAEGMGVATGLALDQEGNLYVGDRTGTIFKISPSRQIYVFATLEPSVAAYHLAFGSDGNLYVSGPTTSSFDCVHRVDPRGEVTEFRRGFGRPQGIAFDAVDRLYLCASYRGKPGIFRLSDEGEPQQIVSGPGIVGLAFSPAQDLIVTTTSSVYRISTAGWL